MRTAKMAKKMRVWMKMALPLVRMLPNSATRWLPGSSKRSPGESSTNRRTPTTTGAQSAIFSGKQPTNKSNLQRRLVRKKESKKMRAEIMSTC
ncbi:hypothetical protein KSP40_PGU012723 [Platanthera guangdongensis]|uniref:Secreted protein n=1 Tax=Platanthera guangdongensis TaxID=2320717 RepID=A0ABR2MM18_9ASPA